MYHAGEARECTPKSRVPDGLSRRRFSFRELAREAGMLTDVDRDRVATVIEALDGDIAKLCEPMEGVYSEECIARTRRRFKGRVVAEMEIALIGQRLLAHAGEQGLALRPRGSVEPFLNGLRDVWVDTFDVDGWEECWERIDGRLLDSMIDGLGTLCGSAVTRLRFGEIVEEGEAA